MAQRIYLDHAATTPLLAAARAAMADGLLGWANPSSPHAEGRAARAALEAARARIAEGLGLEGGRLILTSGATEALTIGFARAHARERLFLATEHEALRRAAPDARVIPVTADGIVDLPALDNLLIHVGHHPLVAVQAVNNETGVIQPIAEVAAVVRAAGGLLLVDCAQSAGKLPLPEADFIALSAHKLGGPPGIGALWARDPGLLEAVGGQEYGYRPGTENLPAVLGFATAVAAGPGWLVDCAALRARLDAAIAAAGGAVVAADAPRLPTIAAYRMPGVQSAAQIIQFDMAGIAVSAGSACSSGSLKPSHVLAAMGWDEAAAREVIRVSFGRSTSGGDVDRFAEEWARLARRRRAA